MEPLWRRHGDLWFVSVLTVGRYTVNIAAMPDDERYSLTELADLAGVTPRTVRYYLAQGLLPAVGQTGPGSKYDAGHLARLRVIRRLQAEHLPLAEIRRRLETLDDGEIRELVDAGEPPPPTDTALEYLRTVLAGPSGVQPSQPAAAAPAPARPGIVGRRSMSLPSVAPARDPIAEVAPGLQLASARGGPGSGPGRNHRPARRPLPVGTDRARAGYRTPHQATAPAGAEQAGRPPRDDRP